MNQTSDMDLALSDRLRESDIIIGLAADGRENALAALAREAEDRGLVVEHRLFLDKLLARESEMSTGVGRGLAAPHAVVAGASKTFVMGALLEAPVEYQSIDSVPVDVVFLIGGRPGEAGLHLQILARIARLARQPEFLGRLRGQKSPKGFVETVRLAEQSLYNLD